MAKKGRRLTLTDTKIKKFCEAREIGASMNLASMYAGVPISTMSLWLQVGREEMERLQQDDAAVPDPDKTMHLKLARQADEADVNAAISWLDVIDKAARMSPDWALRMLRFRFPDDYREPQRIEHTGADGGVIEIELSWEDARIGESEN